MKQVMLVLFLKEVVEHAMAQKKSQQKRNHHYVPEFYLKGFTTLDHSKMIWVYKKGEAFSPGSGKITNNPYRVSIESAGAERDFYAVRNRDGTIDFDKYENRLEVTEKRAMSALRRIRSFQPLNSVDKDRVAEYMMRMLKRVPRGFSAVNGGWTDILESEWNEWQDALSFIEEHVAGFPVESPERRWTARLRAEVERILTEYQHHGVPDYMRLDNMMLEMPMIRTAFLMMRWQYYCAPIGTFFVTNDDPVHFFRGLGLNKPNSEVVFPISSNVALVASWQLHLPERYVHVNEITVHEINSRTIEHATKYVFGREASQSIAAAFDGVEKEHYLLYDPERAYVPTDILRMGRGSNLILP